MAMIGVIARLAALIVAIGLISWLLGLSDVGSGAVLLGALYHERKSEAGSMSRSRSGRQDLRCCERNRSEGATLLWRSLLLNMHVRPHLQIYAFVPRASNCSEGCPSDGCAKV
jgi:hypothetical protein